MLKVSQIPSEQLQEKTSILELEPLLSASKLKLVFQQDWEVKSSWD